MDERIYPLTFEPVFRDYIWGGRHLETLLGRKLPPGRVAESWDVSGHPSSPTPVDAGHWRGQTLPQVLDELGTDLVGTRSSAMLARGKFPLLVKLLDANRDLSVQVHPDDTYATANENGELGKTEMWYVLHAQPGTELIYGLARDVTPASFRAAIEANTLHTQLHRLAIAPGDCVFIPAGSVHALLAGAVVAEIQQNSDTTYRVHDWGRLGDDGVPRPLHVDKAIDVIDWSLQEPTRVAPQPLEAPAGVGRELLVDCEQFTVERVTLDGNARLTGTCDGTTFELWGCMAGAAAIEWAGDAMVLDAVRFALLPAALGAFTVRAPQGATLLRAYLRPPAGE